MAPREAPRWWPVISGVFLGYLFALFLFGLCGLVLDLIGVMTWPRGTDGEGWLAGPFEPDGPWSVFADALIAFTVLAVTSWSVVWQLSERIQLRVSWLVTFVVLCLTGYVPFFFFEGRIRLSGLFGLLLSAGLIRWFGVAGTQPADLLADASRRSLGDRRRRKRLVFAVAVAWTAALGVGVAYGVTHPVRTSGTSAEGRWVTVDGHTHAVYRGEPGQMRVVSFFLHNNGFADVTVATVEPVSGETLAVHHVAPGVLPPDQVPSEATATTFTIPGRAEAEVALAFTIPTCREGTQSVTRVRINYTVFGRDETQVIPVDPIISAKCAQRG
jgi:hypothetical protein